MMQFSKLSQLLFPAKKQKKSQTIMCALFYELIFL